MANQNHITKPLSAMFRDPSLRAAFPAAEDDGACPGIRGDRPPDEIDRLLEFLDASDINPDLEETGDDDALARFGALDDLYHGPHSTTEPARDHTQILLSGLLGRYNSAVSERGFSCLRTALVLEW